MAHNTNHPFGSDTISKFEKSAPMRIAEGNVLAEYYPLMAIYLYGYAAEMTIKAAYFKNLGFGLLDEIDTYTRNRAMTRAMDLRLMEREPHDIPGWARLLVWEKRTLHTPAYNPRLEKEIVAKSISIYEKWRPVMRYRHSSAPLSSVAAVRSSAQWIIAKYPSL